MIMLLIFEAINTFNKLINKRHDKLLKWSKQINHDNLTYHFKGKNILEKSFNDFDNEFSDALRDGEITLKKKLKWF